MFKFILFVYFSIVTSLVAQSDSNSVSIYLQTGFRLHDDAYEDIRSGGGRRILSSPTLGLMAKHSKIPLRIGTQLDFNTVFSVPVQDSSNFVYWTIAETRIEYQIQGYYDFDHFFLGLGYFWKRRENFGNHEIPGVFTWKYSGVQTSVGIPLNWIDLEFRTKINIEPFFAALGSAQHSILLFYNFDNKHRKRITHTNIRVNALLGARFFSTKNIKLLVGEDLFPIGISPLAGLEILHKKTRLSINIERDWWIAINGGSFRRELKGYINSAFFGFGYHKMLKNNHYARIKIGGSFIIDYDKLAEYRSNTPNVNQLINYQVKGIGVMVSYEFLHNTDLEFKHTFPIIGDKLFNPTYFSIGLVRRVNPSGN